MGFDTIRPLGLSGINSNIRISPNRYSIGFGNENAPDRVEFQSVGKFTTEKFLISQIQSNPKITQILKEMGTIPVLNMEELRKLQEGHATDTKRIVMEIAENLPPAMKARVNIKSLQDAAYLHDLGKVLIPKEVLNKPAKLTAEEQKIMHRHSELSYELLKNTNLNPETLNLIRYHHQNANHNGYPTVDSNFNADINLQILTLADKFSALRENRVYKAPLSTKEALTIISKDVQDGNIHPFIFKALINSQNKIMEKQAV